MPADGATVLIHVQHLLGTGHAVRAACLAAAFADAGWHAHLATGGVPLPHLPSGRARVHQLPPARAADADFSGLLDEDGRPADEPWYEARRDLLLGLYRDVAPDILITEQFPFGRRQFRFELLPLLERARAAKPRPLLVCSVRDVLVGRSEKRNRETVRMVRSRYDAVLVHGDPALLPLEESFPLAAEIADRIRYTGYVDNPPPAAASGRDMSPARAGEIVVSSGGGAVGGPLCNAAAAAALADPQQRPWRILFGRDLPADDVEAVRAAASRSGGRLIAEPARPDFRRLLANAAASISQAGYNTAMDLIATGCPAVLVPFEHGKETEQTQRSLALARAGFASVVRQAELSPAALLAAMSALGDKPAARPPVRLDGATRTVSICADLLSEKRGANR